jgi:Fe-S-cluster containining protein
MARPDLNDIKQNPCAGCSMCCRYIAMEIDRPEEKKDVEQIRWFLLHKDVWIFIDHDHSWNIQFNTPCEKLDGHLCSIYEKRPQICRDYSTDNCEKYGNGDSFKILWKHEGEFSEWLKDNDPYKKKF